MDSPSLRPTCCFAPISFPWEAGRGVCGRWAMGHSFVKVSANGANKYSAMARRWHRRQLFRSEALSVGRIKAGTPGPESEQVGSFRFWLRRRS